MKPFAYARASDFDDAVRLLQQNPGSLCIAGGTTVVDLLKERVFEPELLVDISHITEDDVDALADRIEIGALARMTQVADHPEIIAEFPAVAQAIGASASAQLRNMATIGGNLLQRTRCVYFRDVVTPCNKRHRGEGCSAVGGWNRQHAVLGTSKHCIAAHPSDLAVAFVACDARVQIAGRSGMRCVDLASFYYLPGTTPDVEHVLARDEVITGVVLPRSAVARNATYLKLRDRASFEFALVSVAAGLELSHGMILQARIALGGVATKPWRALEAERALVGKPAVPSMFKLAAETALYGARGYGDNEFKIPLARRAVERALTSLVAQP